MQIEDRGRQVTVVAFNGMAARNRVFEWTRSFARLPANFVGVEDPALAWYQVGTLDLAERVRGAVAGLGGRRLVMIGGSAGGFAALLFGRMLGADRVLAFCPQTACGKAKRDLGDRRWRRFCLATPETPWSDIAGAHPAADVHVAADDALDVLHARRLEPRRLIVHPAGGHQLPALLKDSGRLRSIVAECLQ